MEQNNRHFVVIDRNRLDLTIAQSAIKNACSYASLHSFTEIEKAVDFIAKSSFYTEKRAKLIIVTDKHSGQPEKFDFIENLIINLKGVVENYEIILTSPVFHENDLKKVKGYSSIKQTLLRPLNAPSNLVLLGQY